MPIDHERPTMNRYIDTRGNVSDALSFCEAIVEGIAPGGGLFVPQQIPSMSVEEICALAELPYAQRAARVYRAFEVDVADDAIDSLMAGAYGPQFDDERIAPVVDLGDGIHVLELFHGPTSAFKDMALQCLPRFFEHATDKLREEGRLDHDHLILVATSGDTGKAALAGFCGVPGTRIIVFYPENGVSEVQKKQMVSQAGANVRVCAVRGNFDDTQTGVKEIFAAGLKENCGVRLSSANSINIGRLAPQVVYYFKAYADLVKSGRISCGEKVDFVVPTGNFGDILAGYLAKRMGLPVGKLVCASNRNDVLTDFLRTGTYDRRRPFYQTISPSMDILVSSNLERLLWLLTEDEAEVAGYMRSLKENGCYTVSEELLSKLHGEFACGCCDDAQTKETIGRVWETEHYLMDTHTAVAWRVAESYQTDAPVVVLSTASPYKFPTAVLSAIGGDTSGTEFEVMFRLNELTGVPIPPNLARLQKLPVLHRDVIDREEMADYVQRSVAQWDE